MPTNLNEASLEELIVSQMSEAEGTPVWFEGKSTDFSAAYCLDLPRFRDFIRSTQPLFIDALDLDGDSPTTHKFLARLQGEITKQGIVACLRNGITHGQHQVDLYYPTPAAQNPRATELFAENRFTVTRQVHYSSSAAMKSLDLVLRVSRGDDVAVVLGDDGF